MRSIYKYDIVAARDSIIEGPITKLLTAQDQYGTIVVWAEVDTDAPVRKFEVFPIGTGRPLDPPFGRECVLDTHTYLSTVQFAGGNLIFHVYYKDVTPAPVKKSEPPKEKVEKAAVAIKTPKETTFSGTITMINPDILKKFIQ
jgi:hypothetical protein